MTFVQKYLFAPALGAAGVLAGYAVYRRKHPARQSAAAGASDPSTAESRSDLQRLAAVVEQLSTRVVAVEQKGVPGEWLETLNARLASLDHRVTAQNDRIGAIESNYGNIETRLDAILKSLDRRDASPASVLTAA